VLAVILHIYGALLSAVTFQSIVFIVTLCMVSKNEWIRNLDFLRGFNVAAGRKLLNYSSMALVSAATVPVSQLMIRSSIVKYTSLYDAGLWEGMNRISSMYLYVITSSLSVYYLPRMSEIKKKNELRTEIINAYKLIIPPLILMTMAIYLSRNFIIHILFNDKFVGMEKLFAYQLIGDFFKISSWVLAYNMLAKSMTLTYTITEIIGTISYVALSIVTIRAFGNVGATMAYAICCVTYFTTMVVIFRKLVFANFYAK
jgi:PST family polysaccharide transporter